jgi:CelD/BcsL family acetyltransferase involved in cellulose biosynthesis
MPIYAQRRTASRQQNKYSDSQRKEFFKQVLSEYESSGSVELAMLVGNNGDIWAYQLDWLDKGVRYHYMHAYNDKYKQHSPGKLLLFEILKNSFASAEIVRCNFMRGEAEYKSKFANSMQPYVSIELENPWSLKRYATQVAAKLLKLRNALVRDTRDQ